ncbi:hypothetical protein KAW38_04590 [Candidatus Micrarchaeota archaeon]|nr:hypothetical protein [Candidatus Micrarchaeota archaeon]
MDIFKKKKSIISKEAEVKVKNSFGSGYLEKVKEYLRGKKDGNTPVITFPIELVKYLNSLVLKNGIYCLNEKKQNPPEPMIDKNIDKNTAVKEEEPIVSEKLHNLLKKYLSKEKLEIMLETLRTLRGGNPLPKEIESRELELIARLKLNGDIYCLPNEVSGEEEPYGKNKRPESTTISAGIYNIHFGEKEKKKIINLARDFKARGSKEPLKYAIKEICSTYATKYPLSEQEKEDMIKRVMDWLS